MSEEPKEYEYKPKMAHEKTHVNCYHNNGIFHSCKGDMIQFPKHPSGRMGQHYCCQGHAYISWADLGGIDKHYNFKRVYRKVSQ